ncbi:hypothetical protein E2C01_037537 [Portunus trituberculatus]|uniref:Uncharacterized protein n=1 Tax=Portunus trituberculatus TaxID=210409 RepID=A0A5B7FBP0_PORTR|nr:hypothetical protein [Portunus trituberculatus]
MHQITKEGLKISRHSSSPKEGTNKVSNAQCDDFLSGIKGASLGEGADNGNVVQDGDERHHHHPNADAYNSPSTILSAFHQPHTCYSEGLVIAIQGVSDDRSNDDYQSIASH